MAPSDSCLELMCEVEDAARKLADDARRYSGPDWNYGEVADAVRRASARAAASPHDAEAGALLLRLAGVMVRFYFTPPGSPGWAERKEEMLAVVGSVPPEPGGDNDPGTGR